MAYPNKKCTFANRVVRRSKSQNISALALSLNRYYKSATPPFYSDIQSDTRFLIILCKDSANRAQKKAACRFIMPSRLSYAKIVQGEGKAKYFLKKIEASCYARFSHRLPRLLLKAAVAHSPKAHLAQPLRHCLCARQPRERGERRAGRGE